MIVILAFSAILGAGLLSIYDTTQLSVAKRELVNAADASAYSGASIIAQGLNYTAYTNRAILANNALIGQMMAMRSTLSMSEWYWKNTATTWKAFEAIAAALPPPIGPAASRIAGSAEDFAKFWGEKVIHPTKVLAEVLQVTGTAAIGLTNQVIWLSQQVHLADSLAGFEPNMIKIAKENAPDATVDAALHATAFGPLVTLGMFATQFKTKVRSKHRTLGTAEGPKDEYLNYLTEVNRNVTAPPYMGGRSLLPNAVGLWMATGCNMPINPISSLSGAFAPAAGMGQGMDTAVRVVDTFASILGTFANPIMCLYDRHGGSELVQLDDGKMAWTSIDVMAFKVPLIDIRIPVAGGATMSFTEIGKSRQTFPDAIKAFEKHVRSKDAKLYMGNQGEVPPDCVEFLRPGTWDMYAVSRNGRTSYPCAVLAAGVPDDSTKKGLWGGPLSRTTGKVLRSQDGDTATGNLVNTLTQQLQNSMGGATSDLQAAMNSPSTSAPATNPAAGNTNPAPPGISGEVNSATTGLQNTAGLTASGQALVASTWMTGKAHSALLGLSQRLNPANFYVDAAGVAHTALGSNPSAASAGASPGLALQLVLQALGLDGLIDMIKMKVSDGVETPRNENLNKMNNILADGLPPFFWDVRVQDKVQGAKQGQEEDLVFTDSNPDDYNPRRYNLGPLVYLPLIKDMDKIKTAENLGIGGEIMGLPDYDDKRNVMRAIGKARIFFRQPSDQWMNRYKHVVTASLMLPYWQVRNESLSYADKWGLMALDEAANVGKQALDKLGEKLPSKALWKVPNPYRDAP